MTGVRLRSATVADLPAITRIWRQGWADGHAGQVPDALTAQRTPASVDRSWRDLALHLSGADGHRHGSSSRPPIRA